MASRVGVNLRASAYLHQGDRKYMEDEFQVAYQRTHDKKDIEYAFFGIFDGHGGKEAAHFAKDNLMDNIVSQRLFWSENDEDILCAIKEGFLQTHMAMWKELDQWPRTASGWPSTSGTTASIAFIRRQKIYIGHVGDSGIVLGCEHNENEWVGVSLTRDHKPDSVLEMNRITECGGKVIAKSGVPRVVWNRPKSGHQGPVRRSTPMDEIPFLAVARSLGDLWSYNATNNQFVVSPEPDVCVIDIDINHHRCLVFGTDGLWNALSPITAVNIAFNSEKNNEKHYLGVPMGCGKQRLWINPSRCIVIGALDRYQRVGLRADNTSAVTVYLDPPGRPKREVLLEQLSLKKGAQSKNLTPKSPSKKVKEATVKVHVYNQRTTGDDNRGIMFIKERMPKERQCPEEKFEHLTDIDTDTDTDTEIDTNGSQENTVTSISRNDNQENTDTNSNATSVCSECGCTNNSSSSHTHLHSSKLRDSYGEPMSSKVDSNCNAKPKNDAIQIPLISSSTFVEGTEEDKDFPLNCLPVQSSMADSSLVPGTKRRTRSCVSMPLLSKSENKKELSISKMKSVHSPYYQTDTTNRILKSVNRASCLNVDNSSSPFLSNKRKRQREMPQQEERSSKALRVHTRSHTTTYKPMITRSQGKTQLKRKSK